MKTQKRFVQRVLKRYLDNTDIERVYPDGKTEQVLGYAEGVMACVEAHDGTASPGEWTYLFDGQSKPLSFPRDTVGDDIWNTAVAGELGLGNDYYLGEHTVVSADDVQELDDNGKLGDEKVKFCCSRLLSDNGCAFFLETNGDPVVLTDDVDATKDFIRTSGLGSKALIRLIMESDTDETSTYWAVNQIKAAMWTYEEYWNTVLGANRNAEDVIREFELDSKDAQGLDEWLGKAEAAAAAAGGIEIPDEWADYHMGALFELAE